MTAASSILYPSMDLLHPEDTMDLASSPRVPADDLDLPYELDTMRDSSVEPTQEAMIEDPINPDQHYTEDVQLVDEDLLDDEDMVDEDTVVQNADTNHEDFTMEPHQHTLTSAEHEEDDILYDDDELIREDNNEAQNAQDVEIVDEEDLFRDDEVHEHSLEDTSHTSQVLHSNHDEEILDEEQSTNMITKDAEDLGATQGLLFSGDSANNTSDHNVDDQTKLEHDTNHKPDHEQTTDAVVVGETIAKDSATALTDVVNNPQSSDLHEPAKVGQAGSSIADATRDLSHVEASEFPTHDGESAKSAEGGSSMPGSEAEDERFADHRGHTTTLHTVKVNYQDTEICLFPPNEDDDSETFFLADVDLAYQTLDKLLGACHDIVAGTIGDDDELVLDIPSLGLHISQDSSHATQMTLSQILDVYLALSHNDQTDSAEPLYCHLSSRVSLASQHAYLLSAAEQGKTFAEIAAEHLHSHESSPDVGEEVEDEDLVESHTENHKDFEQDEMADDGNLEPKEADIEDTNLEAAQKPLDYPADEGSAAEEVFLNYDQSNSNALDSRPEADGDYVAGIAENETSATSTVRGDELEPQDFETSLDDLAEPVNVALIPGNYSEDDGEVLISNDDDAEDEDGKAETQSAVEDTESSRTVEAGDDTFDQTLNADAEAERESLVADPEDFHDIDAEEPKDTTDELVDTDVQHQLSAESVQVDHLHGYDQDFQPVPQATQESAKSTTPTDVDSEFDPDEFLDVHGEEEGHEFLEQVAPFEPANNILENEASAQAVGHEDLFEVPRSNGIAHKAEGERVAVRDEDDLLLGDDDAKASVLEGTPPATPSNSKISKRKIRDDEDDFDLLDSGTPDFKRRRPS